MKVKSVLPVVFVAMLMLAACGTKPATSDVIVATTAVTIQSYTFTPSEISIKVGETVTWTNLDSVAHNIVADDGSWGSSQLNKGDKFSFTFNQAGSYTYHCGVHPNMIGKIIVSP